MALYLPKTQNKNSKLPFQFINTKLAMAVYKNVTLGGSSKDEPEFWNHKYLAILNSFVIQFIDSEIY